MKFAYPIFLGALLATSQPAFANIDVQFDYRYDSSGFFTGANSSRQNLLNAAASVFETRFKDSLTAITPSGANSFDARFFQPDTGTTTQIPGLSVGADKIVIFVGAYDLGNKLAVGGPGGFSFGGTPTPDFINNASSRGEAGALAPIKTDFGPWGGAMSFNSASNWYLDQNANTDESFSGFDLYSVAVHELAHVLGFGTARSFNNLISGGVFTGSAVNALAGHNPSMTSDGHWESGLTYLGQEVAMDPAIAAGQRKQFTELDFAAMKDMGWQVSPIPEAESWAMMLAGLGLLGWRLRVYRHKA